MMFVGEKKEYFLEILFISKKKKKKMHSNYM